MYMHIHNIHITWQKNLAWNSIWQIQFGRLRDIDEITKSCTWNGGSSFRPLPCNVQTYNQIIYTARVHTQSVKI